MLTEALALPLPAILLAWAIAGGSPGPATLAISGTAMAHGRSQAVVLALGIVSGSVTWGIAAALGFSAVMMANLWLFEAVRYLGAAYLLYLALKSLRSAWRNSPMKSVQTTRKRLYIKGALLHLTNPKAILSWGSVYAIALTPDAHPAAVWVLGGLLICISIVVFVGYACLFSSASIAYAYTKTRRWFELAFGLLFGAASLKILTVRLS